MEALEKRINEVEHVVQMSSLNSKSVLTFEEAAKFTGLSKSYLYKLTSSQRIPHYKPSGKLCYFDRTELEAWLKQNRVSTITEIEEKAQSFCSKS